MSYTHVVIPAETVFTSHPTELGLAFSWWWIVSVTELMSIGQHIIQRIMEEHVENKKS